MKQKKLKMKVVSIASAEEAAFEFARRHAMAKNDTQRQFWNGAIYGMNFAARLRRGPIEMGTLR